MSGFLLIIDDREARFQFGRVERFRVVGAQGFWVGAAIRGGQLVGLHGGQHLARDHLGRHQDGHAVALDLVLGRAAVVPHGEGPVDEVAVRVHLLVRAADQALRI